MGCAGPAPAEHAAMSRPYKKRMVEDDDDSDDDVAPAKAASRAASSGKRRKVDDEDDEEEEGQVSDDDEEGELPEERGRPQPSAPPEPPEDYDSADEYDANLFKGAEDRRQVEAMTEIEREMLMAERYEKHMRRKEVLEIREKAREMREGRKPAGRSRDTKKRLETTNDKSSKMREIAALRKDKEKRKQEESERDQARRKASRDDDDDDDDDEEETRREEEEEAQRREEQRRREEVRRPPSPRALPADLERVRLTRQKLEQWLTEPFFDSVVVGCFVRINVGEKAGMPVYRVAEVKSVKDGFRKYKLGRVMTGKRLELQIGTSVKTFEMTYVSTRDFEQNELSKFHDAQQHAERRGGPPFKSKREIEEKVAELKGCKAHVYTDQEVAAMVEGNKETGLMKGNLAQRRIEMQVKLDAARESGNADEVEKAEAAMAALVGKIGTAKQIDHKVGAGSFKIQDINMRNQEYQYAVEDARGDIALKKERVMS